MEINEGKVLIYMYFSCTKTPCMRKCADPTILRVIRGEIYAHVYTLHLLSPQIKAYGGVSAASSSSVLSFESQS